MYRGDGSAEGVPAQRDDEAQMQARLMPCPVELFPSATPASGDWLLACSGAQVAAEPWSPEYPVGVPLVRVNACTFFLGSADGMRLGSVQGLRALMPREVRFGAFCALHVARWLLEHRYCGRCGAPLTRVETHLVCPQCAHECYPSIAPAVIVGLTYRDKLLVTHYADRPYTGPALVAGYCEVGETAEATCRREALEEAGLTITRLRYFASQPWGLSGTLLMGFFAEVADPEIALADGELADATWLAPNDLPPPPDADGPLSLTALMIDAWRHRAPTLL